MQIKIAERFRPFVHTPGTPCVLPFSTLVFQIFPAFIRVVDLSTETEIAAFPLEVKGPVREFTIQQDLEKGYLKVWGDSPQGFFRYRIEACAVNQFVLIPEKLPEILPQSGKSLPREMIPFERLSFGVTKKPDWDLVSRRLLLAEILPFWFRLGQMTPACSGSFGSLDLKSLFQIGFEGFLCPTFVDKLHQGFSLPSCSGSPLVLLTKGAQLIKEMLITYNDTKIHILPHLLSELHSGRYCDVQLGSVGQLDLEWTKKQARRMIFYSAKDQTLTFNFQKDLKSFRLISGNTSTKTCGEPITFSKGTYFFDHFER